jgi:hypothetical protein
MATGGDEYCGTWIFREETNQAATTRAAYPHGNYVIIGKQGPKANQYMVAWWDRDNVFHALDGLSLKGGVLQAAAARDRADNADHRHWNIEIHYEGLGIKGTVQGDDFGESNLTGQWGADGQPPVDPPGWIAGILQAVRKRRHEGAQRST